MDTSGRSQRRNGALNSAKSTGTQKSGAIKATSTTAARSTENVRRRDIETTSPAAGKSTETVKNRDIKPTPPIVAKSTKNSKNRDVQSTSPAAAKSTKNSKDRNVKPTSPMDPYKCGGCAQLFNDSDRIPMVLPCGHRNCRKCMYGTMSGSLRPTCVVCHERSILVLNLVPVDSGRLARITKRRLLLEGLDQALGKVKEAGESLTVEGVDRLVQRLTSAIMKEMEQLSLENLNKATATEVSEFWTSNKKACDDLLSRRNALNGGGEGSEGLYVVKQESGIRHISKFWVGYGTYSCCDLCERPLQSDGKSYLTHIEGRRHMRAFERYGKGMSAVYDGENSATPSYGVQGVDFVWYA